MQSKSLGVAGRTAGMGLTRRRGVQADGAPPPDAPSSLTATANGTDQIDLAWTDNSDDETGFRVYRSTNGVDFSELTTKAANATSHSDTGLDAETEYWYYVTSYNDAGESTASNTDSDTTEAAAVEGTPSFRAAAVSGFNFAISRTVTKPTGTAEGDMLLAFVRLQSASDVAVTAPEGFTFVDIVQDAGDNMELWKKTATGSEPADYTFSWSGSLWSAVNMVAYQPEVGTISVGTPTKQTNSSGTSHTFPSVTPPTAESRLLCAMVTSGAMTSATPDASMTERADVSNTSHSFYLQDQALTTADPTGTRSATTVSAQTSGTMSFVLYES